MAFILLEIRILDLIDPRKPIPFAVLILLLAASVISWGISLKKLGVLRRAQEGNRAFMRAIRKADNFEQIATASSSIRTAKGIGLRGSIKSRMRISSRIKATES